MEIIIIEKKIIKEIKKAFIIIIITINQKDLLNHVQKFQVNIYQNKIFLLQFQKIKKKKKMKKKQMKKKKKIIILIYKIKNILKME